MGDRLLFHIIFKREGVVIIGLQSIYVGLALGAIPGLIWLLVRAMGGLGVNQPLYFVDVAAGPLIFAIIGGLLGGIVGMLFASISTRSRQPILKSRNAASMVGLLAGIVPGLNGLIFASIFLRCGGDDSLSGYISGCDNLRAFYQLLSTSIAVAGGLLGAVAGRILVVRRNERSLE